jgi:hypothetical protein
MAKFLVTYTYAQGGWFKKSKVFEANSAEEAEALTTEEDPFDDDDEDSWYETIHEDGGTHVDTTVEEATDTDIAWRPRPTT